MEYLKSWSFGEGLLPPTLTIPEDHIFSMGQGTPSLGSLEVAQSPGEVLIYHTADVPLEVTENDAPGVPFSLYWFLPAFGHLYTNLLYFVHCE